MPKLAIYVLVFAGLLISCGKSHCQGKRKKDCACTMQYDPVCGCNKKTYGNACEAGCDGVMDYTQGPCKQ